MGNEWMPQYTSEGAEAGSDDEMLAAFCRSAASPGDEFGLAECGAHLIVRTCRRSLAGASG